MAEQRTWTAEELLALSPAARHAVVAGRIEPDLDNVPPEMLEAVRAAIREHIAQNETSPTSDP